MKKFWKEWKKTIMLFGVLFIVAFLIRIINLTYLPVFADEAIYIRWAQVMGAEPTLRFLPLSDGKQPLFMWILMFLVSRFSDPLFVGRLLSVFTGMGTLVGIFASSYYLFKSKNAALASSLIWAISPFSLFFDRMALVDSMLAMFGVWTFLLATMMAKSKRLDLAMITGFILGGALLTKSSGLFFLLLIPSTWILTKWPTNKKKKISQLINLSFLFLVTILIGLGMYNIQRLGPNFHMLSIRTRDYVFPLSHFWDKPLDPFMPYFHRSLQWLWILGPAVAPIMFLFGFVNFKKYPKELLLVLVWSVLPIAIQSEFAKVFTARYIFFSIPFVFLFVGSTFLTKSKELKRLFTFGLIIFVLHSLYIDKLLLTDIEKAPLPRGERFGYLEEWTAGTGIREVSEIIRDQKLTNPEKGIVVGTEGFFGTLPDGLQIYLNNVPDITVIGVGLSLDKIPSQLIESKQAGNKTYLVVNSSRFSGDADKLGLEFVAVYPKAFRPEGTDKYLLYGPRETLYLFEVTDKAIKL